MRVRPVNVGVADRARLILNSLIVSRPGRRRSRRKVWRRRVALQADGIHIGAIKQARGGPSMREVASGAAFGLHDVMLVDEWSGCLRMALGANRILLGRRLQALPSESSMRIVAIGTLDKPLLHLVVKGHGELRLDVRMALEAERGLGHLEQTLRILAGVDAMAPHA